MILETLGTQETELFDSLDMPNPRPLPIQEMDLTKNSVSCCQMVSKIWK